MFIQGRDIQKIEKTEEVVTASCRNTAPLVFLTENLRGYRALSTPNIFVFIPAHTSLAVSLYCSESAQQTWQWEQKAALCSQGQEEKKGYWLFPSRMAYVKEGKPQKTEYLVSLPRMTTSPFKTDGQLLLRSH